MVIENYYFVATQHTKTNAFLGPEVKAENQGN